MRKTKIICTIGPASEDPATLKQMMDYGMNVARLNFSHGTHEEHKLRIERVRQVAGELDQPVAIILDTKGPEIRTGNLAHGQVNLQAGQRFVLTSRAVIGDAGEVQVSYAKLSQEVCKGSTIL
ncbi:MAG TPA: pyruvate kinase, partial [Syntrophomonas sp.]|nr:pyruvate kinase [Syntrophomonas sp.]